MSSIDDRRKANEEKFFHDEALLFKVRAKRRKYLGMWAAEQMRLSEEDSLKYALDIVQLGMEDQTLAAVVSKILADMNERGLDITEEQIREQMENLHKKAEARVLSDMDDARD